MRRTTTVESADSATHRTTLHHTAPLCNTLQHTRTHCNKLQQSVYLMVRLPGNTRDQHRRSTNSTAHCNTLNHAAPHSTTLQQPTTHILSTCWYACQGMRKTTTVESASSEYACKAFGHAPFSLPPFSGSLPGTHAQPSALMSLYMVDTVANMHGRKLDTRPFRSRSSAAVCLAHIPESQLYKSLYMVNTVVNSE